MKSKDITYRRLLNQRILSSVATSPSQIVQHMGAMQGQDYHGTLWALGLRTGLTQQQIITAIEKREIVRTWPQRGTLHFVMPGDAKWMVELSADRLLRGAITRHKKLGLDNDIFDKSKAILTQALTGGTALSRPNIMEVLEQAGISTKNGRGYHILWYLAQTGVLLIGPMRDKQQTFGLLGEWVKNPIIMTREEAIVELAKRYLTSHGPATLQDFMWWSGLTSADARKGLQVNASQFDNETIEGKQYWMTPRASNLGSAQDSAFLLPGFDEYMLGYKDRGAALNITHANKIVPGGNGMFLPTIIINGQVAGTWKRTVKKDRVIITLSPFKPLTKAELLLLQMPAQHYGHFLGLPTELH